VGRPAAAGPAARAAFDSPAAALVKTIKADFKARPVPVAWDPEANTGAQEASTTLFVGEWTRLFADLRHDGLNVLPVWQMSVWHQERYKAFWPAKSLPDFVGIDMFENTNGNDIAKFHAQKKPTAQRRQTARS
jgi:hypothetical protein